jgi:hypothetical protein
VSISTLGYAKLNWNLLLLATGLFVFPALIGANLRAFSAVALCDISLPPTDRHIHSEAKMHTTGYGIGSSERLGVPESNIEFRRQESLLKTGALQDAIFNSAYFSSIATDEKGVIQILMWAPSGCWVMPRSMF